MHHAVVYSPLEAIYTIVELARQLCEIDCTGKSQLLSDQLSSNQLLGQFVMGEVSHTYHTSLQMTESSLYVLLVSSVMPNKPGQYYHKSFCENHYKRLTGAHLCCQD